MRRQARSTTAACDESARNRTYTHAGLEIAHPDANHRTGGDLQLDHRLSLIGDFVANSENRRNRVELVWPQVQVAGGGDPANAPSRPPQ
jgi:hypothetical protein